MFNVFQMCIEYPSLALFPHLDHTCDSTSDPPTPQIIGVISLNFIMASYSKASRYFSLRMILPDLLLHSTSDLLLFYIRP